MFGEVKPKGGGVPRSVRCSPSFDGLLAEVAGPSHFGSDPIKSFYTLLDNTAPGASKFVFQHSKSALQFLHMNDYALDKAFVSCIVCLSKWLTHTRFPQGIFSWPPSVPPHLLAPEQPAVAPVEDDHGLPIPAAGFPAMSSDGFM